MSNMNKKDIIKSVRMRLRDYRKDVIEHLFDDEYEKELLYTKECCGEPADSIRKVLQKYDRDLYDLLYGLTRDLNRILERQVAINDLLDSIMPMGELIKDLVLDRKKNDK